MFDLAWSEIALIAVVALVVIGPKDLPEAIRGVAKGIQKLRRMASEFQGHADELVREAKLEDVRNTISDIRNFDLKGEIQRHVDKDGSIRDTFAHDPLRDTPPPYTPPTPSVDTAPPAFVPPEPIVEAAPLPPAPVAAAPAFIPPGSVPPANHQA
jgi:sec-independent protein translocase protein TatB